MVLQTVFGMNFFNFQGDDLIVARNFWIYVVMAVLLSGFTVVIWFFCQRSVRRKVPSEGRFRGQLKGDEEI